MFGWLKRRTDFRQLEFTSDCHCHLLPGVDDGVESFDEAVECLRLLHSAGVGKVVLTPHINPDMFPLNTEEFLRGRFEEFVASLPEDLRRLADGSDANQMEISLGAEYMVVPGFEDRDMSSLLQFQPGKVLIEMSCLFPSANMEQVLFEMSLAGITPVIAHPERYLYLADSLDTFERWHDMGAVFQMNLMSLSGAYGRGSMRILRCLRERGWYDCVGSDAHSLCALRESCIPASESTKNLLMARLRQLFPNRF